MTAQIQTRAQQDLKRAVTLIQDFKTREPNTDIQKNFTRRAKQFPALVMQIGLAQALSFSVQQEKKDGALGRAHAELLRQVGEILGQPDTVNHVQDVSAREYMHLTRRVLGAWTYHRRLAISILGDDDGVNDAE